MADSVTTEILSGLLNQGLELLAVVGVLVQDFNGRDNVRARAGHQVDLHPFRLFPRHAILDVKPTDEPRRTEARRIRRERRLNRTHGQAAQLNQPMEDWCQRFVFERIQHAVEVHGLRDMAALGRFVQLRHEPASREQRVDLHRRRVHLIGQRNRLAPAPWLTRRFLNRVAQVGK
jgi:hypothetical protein